MCLKHVTYVLIVIVYGVIGVSGAEYYADLLSHQCFHCLQVALRQYREALRVSDENL